jgi:hypothetical protein
MAKPPGNVDFLLDGDPARARATVQQALEARKFRLTWDSEWAATAERGNKVANAIAGAAAQYFKVGVNVMSADSGHAIVRITRSSTGWMGGAIGASRTTKNFTGLRDELAATFEAAGVLVRVDEST